MSQDSHNHHTKLSFIGVLVTLGIVYGDIGTSPLYVMRAIIKGNPTGATTIDPNFILGALSCIIWTLTIQTTIKYVMITLRADNKGEGGILALYSLVKKMNKPWLYIVAIIGASALVADGVITPSLTVTSAIEGLKEFRPDTPVIQIVIGILIALFVVQQFGTEVIGKLYGPVMLLWFVVLGVFGAFAMVQYPAVFKAFNPYYAIHLLATSPKALLIMGAVFLCTTGAEALYSDLGHCGIKNIRVSWIFVKASLILNYLGQGAWVMTHQAEALKGVNPFFQIIPFGGHNMLIFLVILATAAAVIASQALISGCYTIFSEAMSLQFFTRLEIDYPSKVKGQMYIPFVNWSLLVLCIIVVLYFKESAHMEAAYGLSITVTMLMTTVLVIMWLNSKKVAKPLIVLFGLTYFIIEGGFFYANVLKFMEGGWVTVALAGVLAIMMYVWYNGKQMKNKYVQYVQVEDYYNVLTELKNDTTVPKYATNLVYLSKSNEPNKIENKILYSIINKKPKRADHYFFIHVNQDANPYTLNYEFTPLIDNTLYRVDFNIGFKIEPLVSIYFRQVIEELVKEGKFDILSTHPSLRKHNVTGDFQFIILDRVFAHDYLFNLKERTIMRLYSWMRHIGITDVQSYGLDTSNIKVEKVPLVVGQYYKNQIKLREVPQA